ncbi:MAG: GNAT family N-acetyltransferase [Chloroflexi bacterium]|nr:GNAT family N-acetyltransferase [Chloroflexota bacterium]
MPANVRHAKPEDAEQIAEIVREIMADNAEDIGIDVPLSHADVLLWMHRHGDNGALFVIDDGRHLLAFGSVDFNSARPNECVIGAWVRPLNRRQGHATALAEEGIAFARDHGYRKVRARLPENNEAALSFLSSIGALVPLFNPGATYELPLYPEQREQA